MGKASGVSRRRRKKFNYQINRKKLQLKAKKKVRIECETISSAWDNKKSMRNNLLQMGLSYNPNKTMPPPSTKDMFYLRRPKSKSGTSKTPNVVLNTDVVQELEGQANEPKPKAFRLSQDAVNLCVYMLETHGEDYKAMSRDPKNYFQETPKQLKQKIQKFKSIPEQWNGYLRAKDLVTESNVDEDMLSG